MKTFIQHLSKSSFICAFLLSGIFSCSLPKEQDVIHLDSNIDIKLVKEVENSPSNVVWVIYSSLNPGEKALLWRRHLSKVMLDKKYGKKQKEHIERLYSIVDASLYTKLGTPEFETFMDDFHNEWFVKAVDDKLFTINELMFISSLDGIGKDYNPKNGRIMATMASCNCRYAGSCLNNSCPDNRACTEASFENKFTCGILGTSRCTGKCLNP